MIKIFAHRGFRAIYPENTMLAFQKALELGVYGIELDVQLTRDGEVVVIHDETVDRTTHGSGEVRSLDLCAIKTLNAGRGERVPALAEYFDLVRSADIITNIEFKNSVVPYEGMEEKVLSLIGEYGLSERVILSSFKLSCVKKLRALAPGIKTGFIVSDIRDAQGLSGMMREQGIEYLHPGIQCYKRHRDAIREKFRVNVFTVNDEAEIRKLEAEGVNGVFTDNPGVLKEGS